MRCLVSATLWPQPPPQTTHEPRLVLVPFVNKEKTKLIRPPWGDPRPRFNDDKISESKEVKKWVDNYLGMGEWIMDQSVAVLGASGWFERRR